MAGGGGDPCVLSEDVLLCARRLELAWRLGQSVSPDDCRRLARILHVAAYDAAAFEGVPLAPVQVQPAPDVLELPVAYARCVTPAPSGARAQILPFTRPAPDG